MNLDAAQTRIGSRQVGEGAPVFVIAELGLNHNGSLALAKRLIDDAVAAGADAVKLQKRTPESCVPREQWSIERDTPWGRLTSLACRRRLELGAAEYAEIDRHCRERGIAWLASCADDDGVDFFADLGNAAFKAASSALVNLPLLRRMRATGKPLILSTGLASGAAIGRAVAAVGSDELLIAHAAACFPSRADDLNLRAISSLQRQFRYCPVGYSGREASLAPTWAAVALGASFVERRITLDRTLWGEGQAAALDIPGFARLVATIREIERALGDRPRRTLDDWPARPVTPLPTSLADGAAALPRN